METRRSGAYGWLAGVTTHVVEGTVQLQQPVDQDGSYHAALRGKGAIGRKAKALTCVAYYGLVRRMPDLLRFRLAMYGPRTETKVGIRSYQLHWILDLTDHLQRLIAAEVHELELRDVTTGLLRPGDVAIDIGANVGAHALAWGREVGPAGRVFAFEPVPPNFQSLVKNVEGNGLQSVVIPIELALGSEDSALLLAHARGGSTSGGYSAFGEGPSYQVQQRRLDDVVTELNISGSVRLIKIDVEGWECRVLEGAREVIARWRPFIAIERNKGYDVSDLDEALRRLSDHEYAVYQLGTTRLRRTFKLATFERSSATAQICDLLLVPPGETTPHSS